MAEIPIQRKERRSMWPFLVLLLLVVAGGWYYWSTRSVMQNTAAVADTTATGVANGGVSLDSAARRDSSAAKVPMTPDTTRKP